MKEITLIIYILIGWWLSGFIPILIFVLIKQKYITGFDFILCVINGRLGVIIPILFLIDRLLEEK